MLHNMQITGTKYGFGDQIVLYSIIILIYGDILAIIKEEQFRAMSSRSFQHYAYSDYSTYSENWKLA